MAWISQAAITDNIKGAGRLRRSLMDGWPVDVGALHFQQLDHAIHDRAFMNSQPGVTCEPPT